MIKTNLPLILLVVSLTGCQQKSDIDKCIEAHWEHHKILLRNLEIKLGVADTPMPKETVLKHKLDYRMKCLKAQAGKD
jgi:hypothetical protein